MIRPSRCSPQTPVSLSLIMGERGECLEGTDEHLSRELEGLFPGVGRQPTHRMPVLSNETAGARTEVGVVFNFVVEDSSSSTAVVGSSQFMVFRCLQVLYCHVICPDWEHV